MSGPRLESLPFLMMLLIKRGYCSDQQNRRKDREIEEWPSKSQKQLTAIVYANCIRAVPQAMNLPLSASERQSGVVRGDAAPELSVYFGNT